MVKMLFSLVTALVGCLTCVVAMSVTVSVRSGARSGRITVLNEVYASKQACTYVIVHWSTIGNMKTEGSSSKPESIPNPFAEALAKIVSLPRAEMQRRLESAPKESVSRNKRYKYVPAKPQTKP